MIMLIDLDSPSLPTPFPITETPEERRRRKNRESSARHRVRHLERVRESHRENERRRHARNPEAYREYCRQYRLKNREKIRENAAKRRAENREKILEQKRLWRLTNAEKARAWNRHWREKKKRLCSYLSTTGKGFTVALLQNDIYAEASRHVPAGFPTFARDDIVADIVLAVLERKYDRRDIAIRAKDHVKSYWREYGDRRFFSLDGVIPGTDLKRIDRLTYEEAQI